MFQNPNIFFSNLNSNRSDLLDVSNRQKQVKKVFSYQELTFIVWINCFGLSFEFQKFFLITRTFFFLTVGQNNFGNKISNMSLKKCIELISDFFFTLGILVLVPPKFVVYKFLKNCGIDCVKQGWLVFSHFSVK